MAGVTIGVIWCDARQKKVRRTLAGRTAWTHQIPPKFHLNSTVVPMGRHLRDVDLVKKHEEAPIKAPKLSIYTVTVSYLVGR